MDGALCQASAIQLVGGGCGGLGQGLGHGFWGYHGGHAPPKGLETYEHLTIKWKENWGRYRIIELIVFLINKLESWTAWNLRNHFESQMNQNAGLIQQVFWDPTDTKKNGFFNQNWHLNQQFVGIKTNTGGFPPTLKWGFSMFQPQKTSSWPKVRMRTSRNLWANHQDPHGGLTTPTTRRLALGTPERRERRLSNFVAIRRGCRGELPMDISWVWRMGDSKKTQDDYWGLENWEF